MNGKNGKDFDLENAVALPNNFDKEDPRDNALSLHALELSRGMSSHDSLSSFEEIPDEGIYIGSEEIEQEYHFSEAAREARPFYEALDELVTDYEALALDRLPSKRQEDAILAFQRTAHRLRALYAVEHGNGNGIKSSPRNFRHTIEELSTLYINTIVSYLPEGEQSAAMTEYIARAETLIGEYNSEVGEDVVPSLKTGDKSRITSGRPSRNQRK